MPSTIENKNILGLGVEDMMICLNRLSYKICCTGHLCNTFHLTRRCVFMQDATSTRQIISRDTCFEKFINFETLGNNVLHMTYTEIGRGIKTVAQKWLHSVMSGNTCFC